MFTRIWRTITKCRWFSAIITPSWLVMAPAACNVSYREPSVKFISCRLLLNCALSHKISCCSPGESAKNARTWYQSAFITFSFYPTLFGCRGNVFLQNLKIRYLSIMCTQSAFMWWKDCENQSGYIWLNTPVIWPCHTRRSQMSSVNSGIDWISRSFHTIYIICAVNGHIEVAISHSIFECQSDEIGSLPLFSQNWLRWPCSLRYRKKRSRSIICTQNVFIWCRLKIAKIVQWILR